MIGMAENSGNRGLHEGIYDDEAKTVFTFGGC